MFSCVFDTFQYGVPGQMWYLIVSNCVKWNFPLLSIRPVHFRFKGCWVICFILSGDPDQKLHSATSDLGMHC